jgi:abhydrolase domain-containing protein 12
LHAEDDFDIPSAHSVDLFDTLLEPSLPAPALTKEELSQPASLSPEQWSIFKSAEELRQRVRGDMVRVDEVDGFGRISRFRRSGGDEVVFVESRWGAHDHVGRMEGVVDVVGQVLGIKRV